MILQLGTWARTLTVIAITLASSLPSPANAFFVYGRDMSVKTGLVAFEGKWAEIDHDHVSRGDYDGDLGRGWCTSYEVVTRKLLNPSYDLDASLSVDGDSVIASSCGTREKPGATERFELEAADLERKGARTLPEFAASLAEPIELRLTSRSYPIALDLTDHPPVLKLTKSGFELSRVMNDGYPSRFDFDGKLVGFRDVEIVRNDRGRISTIRSPQGDVTFTYDDHGARLLRVDDSDGTSTTYQYDERNLLSKVTNKRGDTTFRFSDSLNITEVFLPDGRFEAAFYDEDGDRVSGTLNMNGCVEMYSRINSDKPTRFKIQGVYNCKGIDLAQKSATYEFVDGGYRSTTEDIYFDDNDISESLYFSLSTY